MLILYMFALILHTVFCLYPCEKNLILPQEIEDPSEIVGNWTYIYHWDNTENGAKLDDTTKKHGVCPYVSISLFTPKDADEIKTKCAGSNTVLPFEWEDAKLKFESALMNIGDIMIFGGKKKYWIAVDCDHSFQAELKWVNKDFIVISNPDLGLSTELLARRPVSLDELECLLTRVNVGQNMKGLRMCSQA